MRLCNDASENELGWSAGSKSSWSIVEGHMKQNFLLVFGVKDSTTLVEFKIACGDIVLNWLVRRTIVRRLGNHTRIGVKDRFAKFFRNYVRKLSD